MSQTGQDHRPTLSVGVGGSVPSKFNSVAWREAHPIDSELGLKPPVALPAEAPVSVEPVPGSFY